MKSERRKHNRLIIKDIAEPIELFVMGEKHTPQEVPAVITNLSAGGMALVVFAHITGDTKLKMDMKLPGMGNMSFEGRVAWTQPKGDTTQVGVKFSHVSHEDAKRINSVAEGYQDCETKLSFGVKDVCFEKCSYWLLCSKPVKLKTKQKH